MKNLRTRIQVLLCVVTMLAQVISPMATVTVNAETTGTVSNTENISSTYVEPVSPSVTYNMNIDWKYMRAADGATFPLATATAGVAKNGKQFYEVGYDDSDWETVSVPHAINADDSFDDVGYDKGEGSLYRGFMFYRKNITIPESDAGKKFILEFEAFRQSIYVYVNGEMVGYYEAGINAVGFDITDYVKPGEENLIAVATENTAARGAEYYTRETIPGNTPGDYSGVAYQWNCTDFNEVQGGLTGNVKLYAKNKIYQTLPLYNNLKTTGNYVYADNFDLRANSADITVEAEVRNETGSSEDITLEVNVVDADGILVVSFETTQAVAAASDTDSDQFLTMVPETAYDESGAGVETGTVDISTVDVTKITATQNVSGLRFWSDVSPYLYKVYTVLKQGDTIIDHQEMTTGFRQVEYDKDRGLLINGVSTYLTGYAQRSTNEWASIGVANDWLSDMDMQLVKESNANMIRWMHIAPNPVDIRAGDKYGVISICPAGDKEGDQTGRTWDQRLEVMRDTIIYYRNSPSIIFWEAGNNAISAEHMKQMTDLRKELDHNGDRFMGSRTISSEEQIAEAEWVGTMCNRHDSGAYDSMVATGNYIPMIETEYHRNESPRRVWDDYTPPEYDYVNKWLGEGGSKKDGYDIWDQTQEDFAVTMASEYSYFYNNRVGGTGKNYYTGAALMVWSDSNMHVRNCATENSRTSGRVDPIRVKKESFYAIQVIQSETPLIEIIGHWNYPEYIEGDRENGNYWYEDKTFVTDASGVSYWEGNGTFLQRDPTNKTVYVIGSTSVSKVELYVNNQLVGTDSKPDDNCVYTFSGIDVTQSGKVSAKAYNERDEVVAEDVVVTSGEATTLRLTPVTGPEGFLADGSDIMYVDVEVVDADGNVCLIDERKITFELSDASKAEFLGGFNSGVGDRIVNHKDYVFAECGINRVFIRSTREAGDFTLTASAEGITPVTISLSAEEFAVDGGLTTTLPQARGQGEVPVVEQKEPAPSLKSLGDVFTVSGNNTYAASEDTRDYYTVSVNGNAVSFTDRPYKPDANTGVVGEVGPILEALKEAGLDLTYIFATEGTLPDYFGREGGVLPWMNITSGERTIELANVATVVFIDGETNLTNFGVTPNSTNTTLKAELSAVIGALPNVSVEMDTTGKICNFVYTPSNEVLLATVTNGDAGILEHDIVEIDTTCDVEANGLTLSEDSSWDGSKYLINETGADVQMDGLSADTTADLLWQADMRFDENGSGAIPANGNKNVGTCITRYDKNDVSYFAVQTGGSKFTTYFEMDTTKWYRVQLVGRYSASDANIDMTVYEYSGTEWVYKGTWESVNLRNLSAGNKSGANHWLVKNGTSVDNMKIIRLSADALQVNAEGGVTEISAGKQLQMIATATREGKAFTTPAITWSVYNADNTAEITDGSVTIDANGLLLVEPTTATQTITVKAEANIIDGTVLSATKQINITAVDLTNYKFDSLTLTADKKYVKAGEPLTIKAAASKNGVSVELAEDDLVWYLCDSTNTRKLGEELKWISLEDGILTVDERAISQDITVRAADATDVVRGNFEVHVKSSDALENGEEGNMDTLLFADNCETTNTKADFVTSVDGSSAYQVITGYDTAVIDTTEDDVVIEMDVKFAKEQAGFYLGNSKGNVNTGIVLYAGDLQVYSGKYGLAENYITDAVTTDDWCHVTVIYNSGSYAHVIVDCYDEKGDIDLSKRVIATDVNQRNGKSVSLVKFDVGVVYDNLRVLTPAATEVTISTDVTEVNAGKKVQVSSEMLWNGLVMRNPDASTFEYKLYDAENRYPLESDEISINSSGVISIDATVEPQDIYVRAIAKVTGVYASEKITIKETEGIFNVTEMGIDEAENRIVEIKVNKVYNYDDEVTFVTTVFDENGAVKAVKAKQLYGESLTLGENTVAIGMDIPADYDKEKDTIKVFTVTRLDADAETTANTEGSSVEIRDNNAYITVPGYDAESDVVVLVLNRDANEKKVQDSNIIYINQVSAENIANAIPVGNLEKCIAKTSGRVNEERVITVALLGEKTPVVEPDVSGGDEEPTPTPTPTATPEPTTTPEPTATPEPTVTPLPTTTPEPTATSAPVTQEEQNGVTYKVSGSGATIDVIDKNATTLTIPDTITTCDGQVYKVTSIAKNAAKGNTKLTTVVIGSNITSIGDYAFYGCKNLKTVTIGKNVTTIGKCAFAKNTSLTAITIPDKVKTVGTSAFDGCIKLKTVKLGKSLTAISDKMFYKCSSLTKVTIPSKVTKIGKSAFASCTKLSSITIGKKVSSIGSNAFSKCTSLKKVTIPASVKTIGANAFNGCKNLKSITIKTTKLTNKTLGNKAFSGINAKATIKVPAKKLADYKTLLVKKGVKKTATIKK